MDKVMSDEKKKQQEAEGEETLVEERRPAWRPQDADREYFLSLIHI